jgi:hypothetical protein
MDFCWAGIHTERYSIMHLQVYDNCIFPPLRSTISSSPHPHIAFSDTACPHVVRDQNAGVRVDGQSN